MKSLNMVASMIKSLSVASLMGSMLFGVTYAAISSTAVLGSNSFSTATLELLMSTDSIAYGSSVPGYTVTSISPGVGSAPKPIYFKNNGGLKMSLSVSANPGYILSGGLVSSDVLIKISGVGCAEPPVTYTLASLESAPADLPCKTLNIGASGRKYNIVFDVSPSAVVVPSVSLGVSDLDLSFTGTF